MAEMVELIQAVENNDMEAAENLRAKVEGVAGSAIPTAPPVTALSTFQYLMERSRGMA